MIVLTSTRPRSISKSSLCSGTIAAFSSESRDSSSERRRLRRLASACGHVSFCNNAQLIMFSMNPSLVKEATRNLSGLRCDSRPRK